MAKVIIFGAGYLGQEVLRLGVLAGHECIAVSRTQRSVATGGRWLAGDVSDPASLSDLRNRSGPADWLVYAVSPEGPLESAYETVYSRGPKHAMEIFPEARFFLISSTRVLGPSPESIIDDFTVTEPADPCAAHIASGEASVLALGPQNIVLRASGIYGPGRTRTADALLTESLTPEEGSVWTNRIHRDDLARLVYFLAARNCGGTFIASDTHPAPLGAMQLELRRIANEVGYRPTEGGGTSRAGRRKSRILRPSRLLDLGFQFQFPSFREGYGHIFADSV